MENAAEALNALQPAAQLTRCMVPQRRALSVHDDMALAAEFAPVRRVGPSVQTPRGLATLALSIQARLKSSLSALRKSANKVRCR